MKAAERSFDITTDITTLSFEKALENLEIIVGNLERGDIPLEESIQIYERGEALKKHCAKLLKNAENKVEKIRLGHEGEILKVEPFDSEEKR